jgi:hypothetical protein
MDRGRVGEDRGSKETDGCPLTLVVVIGCGIGIGASGVGPMFFDSPVLII